MEFCTYQNIYVMKRFLFIVRKQHLMVYDTLVKTLSVEESYLKDGFQVLRKGG